MKITRYRHGQKTTSKMILAQSDNMTSIGYGGSIEEKYFSISSQGQERYFVQLTEKETERLVRMFMEHKRLSGPSFAPLINVTHFE